MNAMPHESPEWVTELYAEVEKALREVRGARTDFENRAEQMIRLAAVMETAMGVMERLERVVLIGNGKDSLLAQNAASAAERKSIRKDIDELKAGASARAKEKDSGRWVLYAALATGVLSLISTIAQAVL